MSWLLRAVGVLMVLTAIALAMSRAPDRPVDSLVARWAPPPSDFIDVGGQIVHLRDEGPRGDPLPIVLLHGTSASLHTWEGWVKALKTQRRVITFDLPGFGLTGPFTGRYAAAGYGGDAYARFVLDVAERLKLTRFVIGGNSLGGEIAWRVAVLAPERVHQLVLVDAAGPPFVPEHFPLGWQLARVPVLNHVLEWVLPRQLVAQGLASVYGEPARITPELVDRYFELTLREGNRRALMERLREMRPGVDAERIASIRRPTLVLWGRRDRLIPLAVGEHFGRTIPGSRLVIFDDLGHVPHEEDAARTVKPVRAFLGLPAS
ncbi:MAG: alpha/beta hydrolase [Betaproteobacteria bacterium]|nr:alpha/beta hydrolase [Betaproteobacteria bacterium]MCC6249398.1 alpha/beta hydrolase [Rubrivivax sp.]MCL4698520.1 alpha/beta hydrolase [Burkholderiaceae bacterium]